VSDKPERFEDLERLYGDLDDEAYWALVDSYDPQATAERLVGLDPDDDYVPDAVRAADGQTVLVVDVDDGEVSITIDEETGEARYEWIEGSGSERVGTAVYVAAPPSLWRPPDP
jgi:hypothetical protein